MMMKSSQTKTPVSAVTLPGVSKLHETGNSKMKDNSEPKKSQSHNTLIVFPNKTQFSYPHNLKMLQDCYHLPPHHARLVAELQGYDLGGIR